MGTSPTPPPLLASPATTPSLPTTRMPLCNTSLRLALLVLLCTLQAGADTALVSTLDALMTATLLSTTPCSWLGTALTRPREITGLRGTAGEPGGERVATSGLPGMLRPSAELTRPQWTGRRVWEAPATMNSTCVASVVSSLTSLGLLELTISPCLEQSLKINLLISHAK